MEASLMGCACECVSVCVCVCRRMRELHIFQVLECGPLSGEGALKKIEAKQD